MAFSIPIEALEERKEKESVQEGKKSRRWEGEKESGENDHQISLAA